MTDTPSFFALGGGLDLVSPPIAIPSGRLLAASNYEPSPSGYRRCDGFERFSGKPKPSDAAYLVIPYTAGTVMPMIGDLVTGGTSGAMGVVLAVPAPTSGTYVGGNAAGLVVLTGVSGAFVPGESVGFAVAGTGITNAASTDADDATWSAAAIEAARALIVKPIGDGGVRGTKTLKGEKYCFRDSLDGMSGGLFRATSGGWQAVDLGWTVKFTAGRTYWDLAFTSGGTYTIAPGDVVTGTVSAKTATVSVVTVDTGTFAGGDAAGTLRVYAKSGAFVAENLDIPGHANSATIAADAVPVNQGAEILEGDTLTGATSGATFVVARIIVDDATSPWTTGTASGRIILVSASYVGTLVIEDLNSATVNAVATTEGAVPNTLPPGGKYDLFNHNFYGATDREAMYGVNGVGPGFEFDGEAFSPVLTGMENDKPTHCWEYSEQLFFGFPGGSIQNSAIGIPLDWTVVLGASEIGLGADIMGALTTSTACIIIAKTKISVLSGNDRTDFVLKTLTDAAGGQEWSIQQAIRSLYIDGNGLRDMTASQTYGGFRAGSVSELIFPLLQKKQSRGVSVVASMHVKQKDLYRVFFSDGTGINVYLGKKYAESAPFSWGINVQTCSADLDADGLTEVVLAGTDDGWVYQLDIGTSFDDKPVIANALLPFNHCGSPALNKQFTNATLEVDCPAAVRLTVTAIFDYGDPAIEPAQAADLQISGGGGLWDEGLWDEILFDAPVKGSVSFDIPGVGSNVAMNIATNAMYEPPHVLTGAWIDYHARGQKKRKVA